MYCNVQDPTANSSADILQTYRTSLPPVFHSGIPLHAPAIVKEEEIDKIPDSYAITN
jgi:hypothetical protein